MSCFRILWVSNDKVVDVVVVYDVSDCLAFLIVSSRLARDSGRMGLVLIFLLVSFALSVLSRLFALEFGVFMG